MRVKLPLLLLVGALALAACTSTTTTTNQPAPTAVPAAAATPPAASPAAPAGAQSGADTHTTAAAPDPCRLLTSDEIKAVQGEEVKETKASQRSDTSFAIGQCFYTTATFSKSISLEVTQPSPGSKTSPRAFWQENFTRAAAAAGGSERERKHEHDKGQDKDKQHNAEEEAEGAPPMRVAGIGDEAFWINSRMSGALYVLKGDRFIRFSLGGTDDNAARQRKAKTLAQKALARF